jgi:rRNA maturation RNase YbeY
MVILEKKEQLKALYMYLDNIQIENQTPHSLAGLMSHGLEKVRVSLGLKKSVFYLFVSDEEMLKLNNQVLEHDYYTDIITFDYEEDDDLEANEVVISLDRVIENAKKNNTTFINELHRVCIHGMLHIFGFKDETEEQKIKMRGEEDHYINLHCST